MGWSEYLAAAGCLSTLVAYQLYEAKATDYKSLSIELYQRIRELEQQLEYECHKSSKSGADEEILDVADSSGISNLNYDEIEILKTNGKNLTIQNQLLKEDAAKAEEEKMNLGKKVEELKVRTSNLESELQNADLEKLSLQNLYQFRLNNEIEKLITTRDLEIANLTCRVKAFEVERNKFNQIIDKLSLVNKKMCGQVDVKDREIDLLEKEKYYMMQKLKSLNQELVDLTSSRQEITILKKKLKSSESRYEDDLKLKKYEVDSASKEISQLNHQVNENKETSTKLLTEIETLKKNDYEAKKIISIRNHEIDNLRTEIEEQSRLLDSKSTQLDKAVETQNDIQTKYKVFGSEIELLFVETTEILKKTEGYLNSNSTSEEFEMLKYSDSKPSSEDFEELNIEDAEKTTTSSSDKDHEQHRTSKSPPEERSGDCSVVSDDLEVKPVKQVNTDDIESILKKIERVKEHLGNIKSAISISSKKEKRLLLQKLNSILAEAPGGSVISSPERAEKLEHNTKKIEELDAKINVLKERNSLNTELEMLKEARNILDDETSEALLENSLVLRIQNSMEKDSQIKALKAELADFSAKVQDHDLHANERSELQKTVTEQDREIHRLKLELKNLLNNAKEIEQVEADLSDKEITFFEKDVLKQQHNNKMDQQSAVRSIVQSRSAGVLPEAGYTNAEQQNSPTVISPNQSFKQPERVTTTSELSPHPPKPKDNQLVTNIVSENPKNVTICLISEEKDGRTSEVSYIQKISDLTRQLQDANLKIAKQHKIISKNLELLKESRSHSSSPMNSPMKK